MRELYGLEVIVASEDEWMIQDEDLRVFLFQIVRELLFNVKKHAGIGRARVVLKEEEGSLVIEVIDEGQGFDMAEVVGREGKRAGFGLYSVRERLRLLGGQLKVVARPGEGTQIEVHTPVPGRSGKVKRAGAVPSSVPPNGGDERGGP
jgi:signal transduction histidine kinase